MVSGVDVYPFDVERKVTASRGQAVTQMAQRVQRDGAVSTARLRWPNDCSVRIFSGQTATQRPHPEQRSGAINSISWSVIEQLLLLPFLDDSLFCADWIVARAGGDNS